MSQVNIPQSSEVVLPVLLDAEAIFAIKLLDLNTRENGIHLFVSNTDTVGHIHVLIFKKSLIR